MLLGYGDYPIHTLTLQGLDRPFAERIRLQAEHRCFDNFKAHARYRSIEKIAVSCRINRDDSASWTCAREGDALAEAFHPRVAVETARVNRAYWSDWRIEFSTNRNIRGEITTPSRFTCLSTRSSAALTLFCRKSARLSRNCFQA